MTRLPFTYILRNLWVRKVTTALTAAGMALVVFVFATVLMMTEGIRQTLVQTGQADNVIVIRRSAGTEVQSSIDRAQASLIETSAAIATNAQGARLISKEPVAIISMAKRGAGGGERAANITVRGTSAIGWALRPQVRLVAGRLFQPGTSEIIVGRSIAAGFKGAALGESLRFAQRDWHVVGVFDAQGSGFDSEVWGDAEQLMQNFRRVAYSAVMLRLVDANHFDALKHQLESDVRLTVEAKRESVFYAEQAQALTTFISILGTALSIIFSIGAIVGAMITMYASVAARTGEIGTLRALGFTRRAILATFLCESLLLGLVGGVMGLSAASLMQNIHLSTINFQTFSELAFGFHLNAVIAVQVLLFALFMGFVGGFLPAARAGRLKIVDALRAT